MVNAGSAETSLYRRTQGAHIDTGIARGGVREPRGAKPGAYGANDVVGAILCGAHIPSAMTESPLRRL